MNIKSQKNPTSITLGLVLLLIGSFLGKAKADPFIPTFVELAPGVWSGVREDNYRLPVMGTATFVITSAGVVVYDGGGAPTMADRIIKKISDLTDKPITHVIISHWHGDHNFGIHRYLEKYPSVQVISHSFTHEVMTGQRIRYIDNNPNFMPGYKKTIQDRLDSKKMPDGSEIQPFAKDYYERVLADADMIHADYNNMKVTIPTITFDDKLVIQSGNKAIELLYLGDGNTAGDIVMWLPEDKVVAVGDIIVHPTPYGFNVPPRKWSQTMRNINALGYEVLVPGHGDIQYDTSFTDLLIETSDNIADQRDKYLADGLSEEEAKEKIDFSHFEERFTGGNPYHTLFWHAYFTGPFRTAAFKALKGEPMVLANPEPNN